MHADPQRVENTIDDLMEEVQSTMPVALGNDVMEYLLKLKQERGPIQNADGVILY